MSSKVSNAHQIQEGNSTTTLHQFIAHCSRFRASSEHGPRTDTVVNVGSTPPPDVGRADVARPRHRRCLRCPPGPSAPRFPWAPLALRAPQAKAGSHRGGSQRGVTREIASWGASLQHLEPGDASGVGFQVLALLAMASTLLAIMFRPFKRRSRRIEKCMTCPFEQLWEN